MSRRYAKNNLNTSLRSGSMSSTSPTVLSAIRKLKEQSQMLLREHKRYQVLNHHISRQNIKQLNKSKQEMFVTAVKESAQQEKQIKRETELKKIAEVKRMYSRNQRLREKNKIMIQNVKKTFVNVNHEVYEHIRQKRKENEEIIQSKRSFVLQSRVSSRKKAEEQEKTRRKSIENFYTSRVEAYRRKKEDEIKQILQKSEQKRKFVQVLSSRNSRILQSKLADSRSLSNRSLENPQPEAVQV